MSGIEIMAAISLATAAAGAAAAAKAQSQAAKADTEAAQFQAQEAEKQAGRQRAVAQFEAGNEREKKDSLLSEQQARFAASGGGVTGSALEVMGETARQGDYNAELRLWEGEQKARGSEDSAIQSLFADSQRRSARPIQRASTILDGVGKIASIAAQSRYLTSPSAESAHYYGGGGSETQASLK